MKKRNPDVGSRIILRKILSKTLFLCYVLAISLVMLELVLRCTHLFGATTLATEHDPLIGYRFIPNHSYSFLNENPKLITGKFNSFGWRDEEWSIKKPPHTYRVAVLGDSFVEAFQVELERTFQSLAERQLRKDLHRPVEIDSFGRSGFTQSEEYLVLTRDIARLSPNMVVLYFFPENDITDISRKTAPVKLRPFYTLSNSGNLILDTGFRESSQYKDHGWRYYLKRHSALAGLLYRLHAGEESQERLRHARIWSIEGYMSLCSAHPDPVYVQNYRINKALITAMARFCHDRGIKFVLACIDEEAYKPEVEKKWKDMDKTININFYEDDMAKFSKSIGCPYIGLERSFRRSFIQNNESLHWGKWGHWNYRGHELAARELVAKIEPIIKKSEVR